MTKWFMTTKRADFSQLAERYKIDPVLARIIRNRDVVTEDEWDQYLYGTMEQIPSADQMKDLKKAVSVLRRSIKEGKKIRIIGDYDVDGICATYVLYRGLTLCNADADYVIPHRVEDGYGINMPMVEQALKDGIDVLLTCDNGISAKEPLEFAKSKGMICIVTDHHEIPFMEKDGQREYILPKVDALIDPKQSDCAYPNKNICGAVVAFKLIQVLFEECEVLADKKEALLRELTEFAGLATVCDVMELKGENRIIVKTALYYMKESANPGLRALFKVNNVEPEEVAAFHLGFIIGPCLNATGRLDTAELALELLCSQDYESAIVYATKLKQLNENRKEMTEKGVQLAISLIEQGEYEQESVLVLYLKEVHESLAGIIAGRIKELYHKPVFVLTKTPDGVKGSARSIDAYDIYEEMTKCKELFTKFGGHKMAAGLSMKEADVVLFRNRINELCRLKPEDFVEKITIDVPMPLSYVTMDLIEQFELLEPFGVGNEKPVFAQKSVQFLAGTIMGKNKNVARFTVKDEAGKTYPLILFKGLENFAEYVNGQFGQGSYENLLSQSKNDTNIIMDIIYYPNINEYRGMRTVQFVLQHYKK